MADRPHGAAAAVVARLPPVPLVRLHAGGGRGARRATTASSRSRATRSGSTSSTWTATASSPGTRSRSRTSPGCSRASPSDGFRVITIIDPGVKYEPGYSVFDQALERDVLCRTEGGDVYIGQVWPGDTAFPDFVTEEGRTWWGELNAAHVQSGLAGIWNDMNEPATGNIPPDRMRFDRGRASHERYHNQYALLMAMGTVSGLRDAMPELRTFVLSRAGFAGIQRYAANWMGDNLSRWDHLWLSIPMANGFGVSGQAFVGADIGGFEGHSNAELFLRWMQYGTLTPFCRNHSAIGNVDQYAWAWGDAVLDLVREAIELRYRLLPYIYAAFLQRLRDRRARPAPAGLRSPVRRDRARPRRPVPLRSRPARRAGDRVRPDRAPGLPARGRLVRLAHGRAGRRRALRARRHPDGADPALRPRRRGHPDVARGAALDRGLPPAGDRAAPVRAGRRGVVFVLPAGGRRAHDLGRFHPHDVRGHAHGGPRRRCAPRSKATATRSSRGRRSS